MAGLRKHGNASTRSQQNKHVVVILLKFCCHHGCKSIREGSVKMSYDCFDPTQLRRNRSLAYTILIRKNTVFEVPAGVTLLLLAPAQIAQLRQLAYPSPQSSPARSPSSSARASAAAGGLDLRPRRTVSRVAQLHRGG